MKVGGGGLLDAYNRRARLAPALLVPLPIAISVAACFPGSVVIWGTLWGLVAWSGGTLLLAQVGREFGKRKEQSLYSRWGGKPTTVLLRHRSTRNGLALRRVHAKLASLTGVPAPTTEAEAADPMRADAVYETWTTFLKEKTRDHERFPLVFEEVCNYGFRRNLWAMKPMGIAAALIGLVTCGAQIARNPSPFALGGAGISALFLAGWAVWFTPAWVKTTADAYAERLLGASEECESKA